jgi:hypothetical protein
MPIPTVPIGSILRPLSVIEARVRGTILAPEGLGVLG